MFTLALYRPEHPARQSMQMALALAMLLEERHGLGPRIKWPNDVLVSGKKIAGILADGVGEWVYLGVGINLTQDSFPEEISDHAISLGTAVERGIDATLGFRLTLLQALLERFASVSAGEAEFSEAIEARLWRRGEQVRVEQVGGGVVEGALSGVTPDGLLRLEGQQRYELAAGELSYREGVYGE
jgi:BirA family transcriptional regulator, biotin operon repressor / biotin---[acetyl-CoA-carboxylase] ligase